MTYLHSFEMWPHFFIFFRLSKMDTENAGQCPQHPQLWGPRAFRGKSEVVYFAGELAEELEVDRPYLEPRRELVFIRIRWRIWPANRRRSFQTPVLLLSDGWNVHKPPGAFQRDSGVQVGFRVSLWDNMHARIHWYENIGFALPEHVSGAWAERKTERAETRLERSGAVSGVQKIKWSMSGSGRSSGTEQWAQNQLHHKNTQSKKFKIEFKSYHKTVSVSSLLLSLLCRE